MRNALRILLAPGIILAVVAIVLSTSYALGTLPVVRKVVVSPSGRIAVLTFAQGEFTDFSEARHVPVEVTVEGTCADLPEGWNAWVCVYPIEACRYYPQYEPVQGEDHWEHEVRIGLEKPEEQGKLFILCLVACCSKASETMEESAQWNKGEMILPYGAYVLDQVVVRRIVENTSS